MKQYGLIGFPLSHSFSKGYFKEKFEREKITDAVYDVFPLERMELFRHLCEREENLAGLNVTIPYKEQIIPYLDELDEEAKAIGAVNTIKFTKGKKIGYNSDGFGFEKSLQPLLKPQHTAALILGTGGASKAVVYVLQKLGIPFQFISRNKSKNTITYQELDDAVVRESTLIVNCSPVGMHPHTQEAPDIPYQVLTDKHLLYDLIYNPDETLFLKYGKMRHAQTKNGLEMLYLQAERSWEIWNR
ncbi:MAG: shikimate dehydrogenase [Sphingobacteriales bacterium]|nr:shikimate dehydrogenase [Sphingobacteriales bacterium]